MEASNLFTASTTQDNNAGVESLLSPRANQDADDEMPQALAASQPVMNAHDLLQRNIDVFSYLSRQRTFTYVQWHRTGDYFTDEPYVYEKLMVMPASGLGASDVVADDGKTPPNLTFDDIRALPQDTMLYHEMSALHLDTGEVHVFRVFQDGTLRRWHHSVPATWRPCAAVLTLAHTCDQQCREVNEEVKQNKAGLWHMYYDMFREGPSYVELPPHLSIPKPTAGSAATTGADTQRRRFRNLKPVV